MWGGERQWKCYHVNFRNIGASQHRWPFMAWILPAAGILGGGVSCRIQSDSGSVLATTLNATGLRLSDNFAISGELDVFVSWLLQVTAGRSSLDWPMPFADGGGLAVFLNGGSLVSETSIALADIHASENSGMEPTVFLFFGGEAGCSLLITSIQAPHAPPRP